MPTSVSRPAIVSIFEQAVASHDADTFAACFTTDYRSEQPAHPSRAFQGNARVRDHWRDIFANVPDLRQQTRAAVVDGDTVWMEIAWSGHTRAGPEFEVRGVIIATARGEQIAAARLYIEPLDRSGETLEDVVRRTTR